MGKERERKGGKAKLGQEVELLLSRTLTKESDGDDTSVDNPEYPRLTTFIRQGCGSSGWRAARRLQEIARTRDDDVMRCVIELPELPGPHELASLD